MGLNNKKYLKKQVSRENEYFRSIDEFILQAQ